MSWARQNEVRVEEFLNLTPTLYDQNLLSVLVFLYHFSLLIHPLNSVCACFIPVVLIPIRSNISVFSA